MTSGDLANAPLIVTDIPTANPYLDQVPDLYSSGASPGIAAGDLSRRFYYGSVPSVMLCMTNVPNSFGINAHQKGIIGVTSTYGYTGSTTLRVVMHKPTSGVKDFRTDWDVIPDAEVVIPTNGPNVTYSGAAAICAQRQGQYAYVFMYYRRNGLLTDTIQTTVYKVTRDEYIQVAGVSGGDQVRDSSSTTAATQPVIQADGGQFFVSDEEQPFVWNVSGTVAGGGTAQMTGFRDDGSENIGSYYTHFNAATNQLEYHYSGQGSAYLQSFKLPDNVYGFGPYIVHPWSSGNYAPPELWYFVQEFDSTGFKATGRFLIYRSRWKRGTYAKPSNVSLDDDSDFMTGNREYPTLNPYGYAWETDIFDEHHYVGAVGPFSGVSGVYNPKNNIVATLQNQQTGAHGTPIAAPPNYHFGGTVPSALPFAFAVIRDKKRYGVLHIVALDGGAYPTGSASLNRVWFANSADDGRTWSRMQQINPALSPATEGTAANPLTIGSVLRTGQPTPIGLQRSDALTYSQWNANTVATPSLVRTHDDVLLMGNLDLYTSYSFADGTPPPYYAQPADAGSKVALAVIDYTGRGVGSWNPDTPVFVRQATRGAVTWQ